MIYKDEIPVGKARNLKGQKFGKLTVLYRTHNIGKMTAWKCQCECGTIKTVRRDALLNDAIKSCGAPMCAGRIINLVGQRFGKLTVISYSDYKNDSSHFAYWNCKCDCGNEVVVMGNNLRTGHTTSCGCVNSQGELLVANLLKLKNINYQTQKTFENCRFVDTNALAKFDFYIENTYLIEYDGIQHFEYKNTDWNTEEKFQITKSHDEYKNQWCKENNIPLIRIPYTKLDTLCIEDLLLETTQFRVV